MKIEEVEKDSTLKGCHFLKIYKHMTYFQGHAATLPTSCQSHALKFNRRHDKRMIMITSIVIEDPKTVSTDWQCFDKTTISHSATKGTEGMHGAKG